MEFAAVEEKLASFFLDLEKEKKSVIIDVTDTYFTGDSLDSKPGKGKDGRKKKLIRIALVVTEKHSFPIFHRTYRGNTSNRNIMDRGMSDPGRKNPSWN